jgi:6-phosphogluconolactonase
MRSGALSLGWLAVWSLAFGLFPVLNAINLNAENAGGENFVYVMTNKNPGNSVIQFRRVSNGSLSWLQEVPSGGNGTGANGADPLGSQDSLLLSGDGRLLLAANAGSNEISVFGVINGKLTWLSKSASGGTFPNSVALSGDLVYVLNAKGTPNISGFRLGSNGSLHAISGAIINLPAGSVGANDIRFSPDGTRLLVTVSGTNQVLLFDVDDNGVASNPITQSSAGGSPFGIRFGHDGVAIVSEAAGSASSYHIGDGDTLDVISGAVNDTQRASCWISVTKSAREAYVSNTGSGTLSSYQISGRGELTLLSAVAANPGGAPIDSALSRDSKFLYVVESAQGKLLIFRSGENLTPIGTISVPVGSQGTAAQ